MADWYFAYGSNLWVHQMTQRIGHVDDPEHPPQIARLKDYRLVFQHLECGGDAFANILSPGPGVVGVLYRCTPEQLRTLDFYESGYERVSLDVTDLSGGVLSAEAYVILPAPGVGYGIPSDQYLTRIVLGATEHGLPKSYIDSIISAAQSGIDRI